MNSNTSPLGCVKQENIEGSEALPRRKPDFDSMGIPVVDLSSSSSSENDGEEHISGLSWLPQVKRSRPADEFTSMQASGGSAQKRSRGEDGGIVLPAGFLEPLPPERTPQRRENYSPLVVNKSANTATCKQFWKAGDYEGDSTATRHTSGGIDHVRVHPKFLHSNATSHKWALGAFAELLDNSLDEVCNGATFVNVDMVKNQRDASPLLLIEDDGGGMDPDKVRQCMSLGYSAKSKSANMIGQYGNGFKTSTMRLGADVIVFSRCRGMDGKSSTQSIGMLSYTFLRSTGQEDIVVPMLDYEIQEDVPKKLIRSTIDDWKRNLETLVQWSPYSSEADLLLQFKRMKDQGTRIILYNLWEDDQGELELDFDTDAHDIQIRGVNRDEKKIQMAQSFPNSRHYLTYQHSLRSYASILYLRLPIGFRIIVRGKDVEHHNLVDDLMYTQEVTYKPQGGPDIIQKETSMIAVVTIGFVKDAKDHIDVQGFNVYHKNRLIKPFWRIWNAAGSEGRGVIGVLEANFVEPAHDKQGFERTTVLARLENRLIQMQKQYWSNNCQKVGYANRRGKKTGKDSVSVPREIGASEISNACLTAAPILQSRAEHIPLVTAEPIPLVRNSVLVTTKSSLVEVEHRLCGKQQSRLNTEQAETENNLSQVLTNVINFPHEVFRQSPSRESSPQMVNNSHQQTQELQRESTEHKQGIARQQSLQMILRESQQLQDRENQHTPEAQCISPESMVQLQDTPHVETYTPANCLQQSETSSTIMSLLSAPTSMSPQQVEMHQSNGGMDSLVATTTQILKSSVGSLQEEPSESHKSLEHLGRLFAKRAVGVEIGSSSRAQVITSYAEIGSSSRIQHCTAGVEFLSSSINKNVTNNGNSSIFDSQSLKQLEEENNQLKKRIKVVLETRQQSLPMEIERNKNLESHALVSMSNRERASGELRTMYAQLNDAEKAVLRSCGLGRACQVMQLLVDTTQLMELIQYWDVARQAFILPTFGEMRITRYDIYRIMGVSRTGDRVVPGICSTSEACIYLAGLNDAALMTHHGINIAVLREDRVPCLRRIIALAIVYRISYSQNFGGIPASWVPTIRKCERGGRFDWATYILEGLCHQLDGIRQRGTGGLSYSSLVLSWLFEHFHAFRPRIGPALPLATDDPAMLKWQMVSRGSPRQESHRRKGGARVAFVQIDISELTRQPYKGMEWDSDDEIVELQDAPQRRQAKPGQAEKGGAEQQAGEVPPVQQVRVEAPVAPAADKPSTNRVADVVSSSGEPTIPVSVVDYRLRDIFHHILPEPVPDAPSRVTSEREAFGPAYRVVAMYEELRQQLAAAQGENKTLRDMIRMGPPSTPSQSRHRSRSRSTSSRRRPSNTREGGGDSRSEMP